MGYALAYVTIAWGWMDFLGNKARNDCLFDSRIALNPRSWKVKASKSGGNARVETKLRNYCLPDSRVALNPEGLESKRAKHKWN